MYLDSVFEAILFIMGNFKTAPLSSNKKVSDQRPNRDNNDCHKISGNFGKVDPSREVAAIYRPIGTIKHTAYDAKKSSRLQPESSICTKKDPPCDFLTTMCSNKKRKDHPTVKIVSVTPQPGL